MNSYIKNHSFNHSYNKYDRFNFKYCKDSLNFLWKINQFRFYLEVLRWSAQTSSLSLKCLVTTLISTASAAKHTRTLLPSSVCFRIASIECTWIAIISLIPILLLWLLLVSSWLLVQEALACLAAATTAHHLSMQFIKRSLEYLIGLVAPDEADEVVDQHKTTNNSDWHWVSLIKRYRKVRDGVHSKDNHAENRLAEGGCCIVNIQNP